MNQARQMKMREYGVSNIISHENTLNLNSLRRKDDFDTKSIASQSQRSTVNGDSETTSAYSYVTSTTT